MILTAPILAAGGLLNVVIASTIAAISTTTIFSLVVLTGAKSSDARRQGDGKKAGIYAGLSLLAFSGFVAIVVFGVDIMVSKH